MECLCLYLWGVWLCYLCVSTWWTFVVPRPAQHLTSFEAVWYLLVSPTPSTLWLCLMMKSGASGFISAYFATLTFTVSSSDFSSEFSSADCPSGRVGSCLKHFCPPAFSSHHPHISFSNLCSSPDPAAPWSPALIALDFCLIYVSMPTVGLFICLLYLLFP